MNKRFIVPILALTFSLPSKAQEVAIDKEAPKRMQRDLFFLASDSLKGRLPGTPESDVARDFIEQRMAEFGLEPYGEDGYRQAFPVPEYAAVDYDKTGALNWAKKFLFLMWISTQWPIAATAKSPEKR